MATSLTTICSLTVSTRQHSHPWESSKTNFLLYRREHSSKANSWRSIRVRKLKVILSITQIFPIHQLNNLLDLCHLFRHSRSDSRRSVQDEENNFPTGHNNLDSYCWLFSHSSQLYPMENSRSPYAVEQWSSIPTSNLGFRQTNKYNFGIFDFTLAKKEAHVAKLMEVYDAHR